MSGQAVNVDEQVVEARLRDELAAARAAWPSIVVSDERFARFLGERAVGSSTDAGAPRTPSDAGTPRTPSDPVRALDQLRIRELYLVCACIDGDAAAIGTFERDYLGEIDAALARLRIPANAIDETKQLLRARFLVGDRGDPPGLAEYAGRGELRGWVRSSAVRAALRLLRQPKGRVELDEEALQALPSPEEDLEIAYLKQTYGAAFETALRAAFTALEPRDRNLLRHAYAGGLTVDELGKLYRVHRTTAARWVAKAREELVVSTRRGLMESLGLDRSEVSSILRLIRSQLDLSLKTMMRGSTQED